MSSSILGFGQNQNERIFGKKPIPLAQISKCIIWMFLPTQFGSDWPPVINQPEKTRYFMLRKKNLINGRAYLKSPQRKNWNNNLPFYQGERKPGQAGNDPMTTAPRRKCRGAVLFIYRKEDQMTSFFFERTRSRTSAPAAARDSAPKPMLAAEPVFGMSASFTGVSSSVSSAKRSGCAAL